MSRAPLLLLTLLATSVCAATVRAPAYCPPQRAYRGVTVAERAPAEGPGWAAPAPAAASAPTLDTRAADGRAG